VCIYIYIHIYTKVQNFTQRPHNGQIDYNITVQKGITSQK
jgi:hypothetical protein